MVAKIAEFGGKFKIPLNLEKFQEFLRIPLKTAPPEIGTSPSEKEPWATDHSGKVTFQLTLALEKNLNARLKIYLWKHFCAENK